MKKFIVSFIVSTLFVFAATSQTTDPSKISISEELNNKIEENKADSRKSISGAFDDITNLFSDVLPENSSLLGAQPDAYIGKLFPSIPLHFTAGLSFSGTFIETATFTDAVQTLADGIQASYKKADPKNSFTIDFDLPSTLPIPSAAFNLRIGGIILPFDLGVYGITTLNDSLKDISADDFKFGLNYTTVGVDLRYELYKGSLFLPKISAGAGYIYSDIGFDFEMSKQVDISVASVSVPSTLDSAVSLSSTTHTIFAQVQASKKLLVFEPYIGVKLFMSRYINKYDWNYETKNGIETIENAFSDKDSSSKTTDFSSDTMATQFFGGLGISLLKFQITLNGAYNAKTNYWSAGIGFNFKN